MNIPFRVGIGYDSHRFEAGRPLMLGGVAIPYPLGLKGHSDADVLIHAVCDALLGATADGDIGAHFPDTDPQWKGADSTAILAAVVDRLRKKGWEVVNIDATVIAQEPKLRPHIDAIRARLAGLLGIPAESVSVKGKTNEGMDATGHKEGIAVHATALVTRSGEG